MKHTPLVTLVLSVSLLPSVLHADEGAGGHYVPGATATFIDALPGKPAFVVANAFTYYDGSASATRPIIFGGQVTLDAHATAYADTLFGVYQTPLRLLGGNYAVAVAIPFVWLDVKGTVTPPVGPAVNRSDSASGLGDITLYPSMLGWTNGPDLKYDVRLGIYAPSGDYEAGKLANTGRNYWTFEPVVSVSWLSTKIGNAAPARRMSTRMPCSSAARLPRGSASITWATTERSTASRRSKITGSSASSTIFSRDGFIPACRTSSISVTGN